MEEPIKFISNKSAPPDHMTVTKPLNAADRFSGRRHNLTFVQSDAYTWTFPRAHLSEFRYSPGRLDLVFPLFTVSAGLEQALDVNRLANEVAQGRISCFMAGWHCTNPGKRELKSIFDEFECFLKKQSRPKWRPGDPLPSSGSILDSHFEQVIKVHLICVNDNSET